MLVKNNCYSSKIIKLVACFFKIKTLFSKNICEGTIRFSVLFYHLLLFLSFKINCALLRKFHALNYTVTHSIIKLINNVLPLQLNQNLFLKHN